MSKNITESILHDLKSATETLVWWSQNEASYADLIAKVEKLGYEVRLTSTGVDISGTGDKQMLVGAFRVLRAECFTPTRRPGAKDTYFSAFFHHEALKSVWFSFSSTICHRVQVGTEMKEVPVYDVVCTDGNMAISDEEIENG